MYSPCLLFPLAKLPPGKPWSLSQVYPRNEISSTSATVNFFSVHRHFLFSPPARERERKEGKQMEAELQT